MILIIINPGFHIKILDKEARTGKAWLVKNPTTLFICSAKDEVCDLVKGTVKNGYLLYVVYIQYATPESTGLPF